MGRAGCRAVRMVQWMACFWSRSVLDVRCPMACFLPDLDGLLVGRGQLWGGEMSLWGSGTSAPLLGISAITPWHALPCPAPKASQSVIPEPWNLPRTHGHLARRTPLLHRSFAPSPLSLRYLLHGPSGTPQDAAPSHPSHTPNHGPITGTPYVILWWPQEACTTLM